MWEVGEVVKEGEMGLAVVVKEGEEREDGAKEAVEKAVEGVAPEGEEKGLQAGGAARD